MQYFFHLLFYLLFVSSLSHCPPEINKEPERMDLETFCSFYNEKIQEVILTEYDENEIRTFIQLYNTTLIIADSTQKLPACLNYKAFSIMLDWSGDLPQLSEQVVFKNDFLYFRKEENAPLERLYIPIEIHPNDPVLIPIENTRRGIIFSSKDQGLTWQLEKNNLPTSIPASFIDIYQDQLILATDYDGIFLQKNNYQWKNISGDLPHQKINALWIDEKEIYASVFQHGIYFTSNEGKDWQSLQVPEPRTMTVIKIGQDILVGGDNGIYKSTSGPSPWKKVFDGEQVISLNLTGDTIVAGSTGGIFLSADQGENWNKIHDQGALHNTAIINGRIIGMYIYNGLFISDDWGKTWYDIPYSPKENSYIYEVSYQDGTYMASNNHGVHRSTDEGGTWSLDYPMNETIFFDFVVKDNTIYACTRSFFDFR